MIYICSTLVDIINGTSNIIFYCAVFTECKIWAVNVSDVVYKMQKLVCVCLYLCVSKKIIGENACMVAVTVLIKVLKQYWFLVPREYFGHSSVYPTYF